MDMKPSQLKLFSVGKAKRLFQESQESQEKLPSSFLWMEFTDNLTAFNGKKHSSFPRKGCINRDISSLIFRFLMAKGIPCHWLSDEEDRSMKVQALQMEPWELVVRNVLAGSTAKKLGLRTGKLLSQPLFELYWKREDLGDPFISEEQAVTLELLSPSSLRQMRSLALAVNEHLKIFFFKANLRLVDFKLEMGWNKNGALCVGDEISPDSCRLWDIKSGRKMDKDCFRWNLEPVEEVYGEVWQRLQSLKEQVVQR